MYVDGLQYIYPSRAVFQQMRLGSLSAVHITVGYHEDFLGVVENLQTWNRWFEECGDLTSLSPKVVIKPPVITTGTAQIYIPVAPPVAYVGCLRGAINSCRTAQELSCRGTFLREQYVQSCSTNPRGHIWYASCHTMAHIEVSSYVYRQ